MITILVHFKFMFLMQALHVYTFPCYIIFRRTYQTQHKRNRFNICTSPTDASVECYLSSYCYYLSCVNNKK